MTFRRSVATTTATVALVAGGLGLSRLGVTFDSAQHFGAVVADHSALTLAAVLVFLLLCGDVSFHIVRTPENGRRSFILSRGGRYRPDDVTVAADRTATSVAGAEADTTEATVDLSTNGADEGAPEDAVDMTADASAETAPEVPIDNELPYWAGYNACLRDAATRGIVLIPQSIEYDPDQLLLPDSGEWPAPASPTNSVEQAEAEERMMWALVHFMLQHSAPGPVGSTGAPAMPASSVAQFAAYRRHAS